MAQYPDRMIVITLALTEQQAIKLDGLLPVGAMHLTEDFGDPDHKIIIDTVYSAVSAALFAARANDKEPTDGNTTRPNGQ